MEGHLTTIKSDTDLDLVAHLLRRAGFGATPEEMDSNEDPIITNFINGLPSEEL